MTVKVSTYGAPPVCTGYLLEALRTLSHPYGSRALCYVDRQEDRCSERWRTISSVIQELEPPTSLRLVEHTPCTTEFHADHFTFILSLMLPEPSLSG